MAGGPGDVVVPFMGDSVPDGVIAAILKKPGDAVAVDEIVAQIETDKVTIDVRSPVAGKIESVTAKEGETVTPGTKVAIVAVGEAGAMPVPSPPPPKEEKVAPPPEPAAPAPQPTPQAPPKTPEKVPPAPAASQSQSPTEVHLPPKGGERRIPMTRLRKRVATRLKDSQNTFALLTTFNEIDMYVFVSLKIWSAARYLCAFVYCMGK
jgi:2-oxoglutarate dehydrogenase E2 component (dihydrolipoamide succinyltransferase)